MTIQDLIKLDIKILFPTAFLGIILSFLFGRAEMLFITLGISMAVCVYCKLKHITKLVEGNVIEECMKAFMKYIYIPVQIFMSLIILGSVIYYSIF